MRTIKANKTQFYELLKKYCPYELPQMKDTDFEKAMRADAYWLRFSNQKFQWVVAYMEMFCDRPMLRITCRMDDCDMTIPVMEKDVADMVRQTGLRENEKMHPWIIRWTDDGKQVCYTGTKKEVEKYAEVRCKELGKPGYIIA